MSLRYFPAMTTKYIRHCRPPLALLKYVACNMGLGDWTSFPFADICFHLIIVWYNLHELQMTITTDPFPESMDVHCRKLKLKFTDDKKEFVRSHQKLSVSPRITRTPASQRKNLVHLPQTYTVQNSNPPFCMPLLLMLKFWSKRWSLYVGD